MANNPETGKNRTEVSFTLGRMAPEAKKNVRDALKAALAAEIKRDKKKNVIADHSSAHSSGHSSAPSLEAGSAVE